MITFLLSDDDEVNLSEEDEVDMENIDLSVSGRCQHLKTLFVCI